MAIPSWSLSRGDRVLFRSKIDETPAWIGARVCGTVHRPPDSGDTEPVKWAVLLAPSEVLGAQGGETVVVRVRVSELRRHGSMAAAFDVGPDDELPPGVLTTKRTSPLPTSTPARVSALAAKPPS